MLGGIELPIRIPYFFLTKEVLLEVLALEKEPLNSFYVDQVGADPVDEGWLSTVDLVLLVCLVDLVSLVGLVLEVKSRMSEVRDHSGKR